MAATGSTPQHGAGAKRTYVIEPAFDPDTGEMVQDRAKVAQIVGDLLGTLWTVGGAMRVVSDRILTGELPPAREGDRGEPLGETVGMVIEFQANTPLHRQSVTQAMLDGAEREPERVEEPAADVAGDEDGGDELEPGAGED